jgi:hypothetical protein
MRDGRAVRGIFFAHVPAFSAHSVVRRAFARRAVAGAAETAIAGCSLKHCGNQHCPLHGHKGECCHYIMELSQYEIFLAFYSDII